jgi:penicillin-binding protein 1A
MLAVGQAPESKCPWHGGSVFTAQGDENAPQLIMAPQDDSIRGQYQLANLPNEEQGEQIFQSAVLPAPNEVSNPLPPPDIEPYRYDPSPANDIEKRYQDLLDQYNIR